MAFSDFIEAIATTRSNDLYMTARNAAANQGLLREMWSDVGAPPAFLDGSTPDPSGFLWFGPAGTITPTYHDLTNNLLVQVLGRKKVVLADMRAR